MALTDMISPFMNGDTVVLTDGATLTLPDQNALSNPLKTAMLVDEIRFMTNANNANPQAILADLRIGRQPLTRGFVSLPLFGRIKQESSEYSIWTGAGEAFNLNTIVWRFHKPMYVPAGKQIDAVFRQDVSGSYGALPVIGANSLTVVIVGRSLPRTYTVPVKSCLPWIAPWYINYPNGILISSQYRSTASDLVNPHKEDLHIVSLNGFSIDDQTGHVLTSDEDNGVNGDPPLQVKITDDKTRPIVKDWTPFYHLMQSIDRKWSVRGTLPYKGYYIASIKSSANYANAAGVQLNFFEMMALNGYREVATMDLR